MIVVAPTAFKGTLSPRQAAKAIASGLRRVHPRAEILLLPVADGGDGTREVLANGAPEKRLPVHNPLGKSILAPYSLIKDTAIIEMAEASGLKLLRTRERNPEITSSFGTGELVRAAWESGARRILLGVGGSATVDGGRGAIEAIGNARRICPSITVLCDVKTRYLQAPEIYGPQKGASPEAVDRLKEKLRAWNETLPRDVRRLRGGGAAGGLAGGLAAFGAKLVPGAPFILRELHFSRRIQGASLLLTGEGRFDRTSLQGKAVGEILKQTKGIPHRILCGESTIRKAGIFEMARLAGSRERAMRAPIQWLRRAAEEAALSCR